MPFLIIIAAILLLSGLLLFEKRENRKAMVPTKTLLSLLFVAAAAVQPHPLPGFAGLVMTGLVFCLAGDVLLALPQQRTFLFGLVSFLVGHLFYVFAFVSVSGIDRLAWVGLLQTAVLGVWIYRWLKPHLGAMKLPVICYIFVISIMVCGAWSVLGARQLDGAGRTLLFAGAMSFYASDILVARDRFIQNAFFNRLVGLPLYYAGQFCIAFSLGAMA